MALTVTTGVFCFLRWIHNNFAEFHGVKKFRIVHFNDVYNAEPRERSPKGGVARFATKLYEVWNEDTLVLFSGDVLSPSTISNVTRGMHWPPILNLLKVDCAMYGNHEFDFGLDGLQMCVDQTTFPWLMSNAVDKATQLPLGNGKEYHILDKFGVRIGLIGLIEHEWLQTLSAVDMDDIEFTDYCEAAGILTNHLRNIEHCDIIVALTHMRWPNDTKLAQHPSGIDLILGGHDHKYEIKKVNNVLIIKSGSDFHQFTKIDVSINTNSNSKNSDKPLFKHVRMNIDDDIVEDPTIKAIVDSNVSTLDEQMERVLGKIDVALEGRFEYVRTQETNMGNLISDVMIANVEADLGIINAGSLRADSIIQAGDFKVRDLNTILPFLDPILVLQITGPQLLVTLENGVSQYPKHEGRFPCVSGVRFTFDESAAPNSRILATDVFIKDQPLDLNKNDYRIAVKRYMAKGCDGYDVFKECPILLGEQDGPMLSTCVQNFFAGVKIRRNSLPTTSSNPADSKDTYQLVQHSEILSASKDVETSSNDQVSSSSKPMNEEVNQCVQIAPRVEGRIKLK